MNPLIENKPVNRKSNSPKSGLLIVNADDWGRDAETTNRILDCVLHGSVSSASAMVFMQDSERAAMLACAKGVDVGLHLNFTTSFEMPGCTTRLANHQSRLGHFLSRNRLSQMYFHPGLASSFRYVVAAQLEEFRRLYNSEPPRIDGHHHMHLCANVVFAGLLPAGTITRRNFSFQSGEKSAVNRLYRRFIDNILAKRHRLTDFFYSLPPLEPSERLTRIMTLAKHFVVEVETHPVNPEEYRFLMTDKIFNQIGDVPIAPNYRL